MVQVLNKIYTNNACIEFVYFIKRINQNSEDQERIAPRFKKTSEKDCFPEILKLKEVILT